MKLLFENWRNYLKEEEGIGCPIRGGIYGGIPSGGDFLATTEYEVAASNIAEAAHCILGSLGKRIGALAGDMDKSEWEGMVYGETEHLTEEIGIIVQALKEYQRDVYTRQINDIEQYKPQFQDRIRETNEKMVADIREKAPKLIENAQDKLARLDKVEATEPDFPPQVMAVGRLSYQLLISLSESLLKSVENWDETKQIPPELNAYKNKDLQALGNRLNGAIKIMIQEMGGGDQEELDENDYPITAKRANKEINQVITPTKKKNAQTKLPGWKQLTADYKGSAPPGAGGS